MKEKRPKTPKQLEAAAINGAGAKPGRKPFTEEEEAKRTRAVRALRRLTLEGAKTVIKIMREMKRLATADAEATNMDKISAARVAILAAQTVFDRGGVPAVSQLEVSGDQLQPLLLISGHHAKPGAPVELEPSERQAEGEALH